jgi:hypothetical protein
MVYHNPHNGLDASGPEAPHAYGPSLRRLWVEARGRGSAHSEAWEQIEAWARHPPEAWGRKGKGSKPGATASLAASPERLVRPVEWNFTGDVEVPWTAQMEGQTWQVRLNDFPDEWMYSLLVNGVEAGDFHDWPKVWQRD